MKKLWAIILACSLIAVQIIVVLPVVAQDSNGNGEIITTFTEYDSWYNKNHGYTKDIEMVSDNYNFTSAFTFKVTNKDVFDGLTGGSKDIYFYRTNSQSIEDWANNPDAEMRFWVKSTTDFSTKLSIMCRTSNGYPHAYKQIDVSASDKWQEIRLKRSDFTADGGFNSATGGSFQYCTIRFQTVANFIQANETIQVSPAEFYDGKIAEEIDENGGTIIVTPQEGVKITDFKDNCWYSANDGFTKNFQTVGDNRNFTSALAFEITDREAFDKVTNRNVSWYENKTVHIADWVKTPYAEMRFWIRSTVDFTTTLSVMAYTGSAYPHITTELTVKASDKWQEIRFKSEDFTGDFGALNAALEGNYQYCLVRFMTSNGFVEVGEKIEMSPVEFYNGYIAEPLDPDGGTIIVVPEEGEKIAEFSSECWNSESKGFSISGEIVDDNSNFKKALKFQITDKEAFNKATDRNANFYETKQENIAEWAKHSYADMRFWVRTNVDFTTTLSIMTFTGNSYPHITAELTVKASDKWQEIRLKNEDFTGDSAALIAALEGEYEYSLVRFITSADFISTDGVIEISPIEFYDGYINGEIDPSGGTIVIPDIYGELKTTMPAKVINSFKGLENKTVSVTDNEFVSNALKLTATDTNALYEKRQHVYTNESPTGAVDLSDWYNYSKAEIRLWVKVPHAMEITFLIVEQTPTAYPYISATVNVPAADGWQELRIPRSTFSSNDAFTGEYTKFFRILTPEGEGAQEKFLGFCESMYISQIEFYDGIIPESANQVDKGAAGNLLTTVDLKPANVNSSVIGEVDVTNNSNFKKAVAVQIENARTFASGEKTHYIHLSEELIDVSKWYNNPNAEMRFWIKTDKDVVLRLGLQNPFSKTPSSYRAIWGQISVSGSDKWQEVRLVKKNFSENKDFDPTAVGRIKLIGEGDTAITTNEVFYVSDIEIYDGYVNKVIDSNGGTTSVSDENAVVATFSSFSTKITSGNGLTAESVLAETNKYFTTSARLAASSATDYNVSLKTFYDLSDVSRGKNGTLRLWAMSGSVQSFNIVLTDKNGKTITLPFSTKASDKWQELRAELSSVDTSGFDFTKLFSVSVTGSIAGGALEIGKIELWKKTLSSKIESDGGTLETPLVLPPDWASLPTYTGESEIFAKTSTSQFWINDWNDKSRPRSITAYNRGVDNKDENYYRFTVFKEISVVEPSVYYQNPTPAGFGFNNAVDFTPYLKTGTMRFWINVPKNMTVKITLKSQVDGKYTDSSVEIPLKKTTESGGFQEVQIPLKKFYDSAIAAGTKWNPYFIKHILIGGVDGCNASTFLAKDEKLLVTQFEFWKGIALEPEPYDPTRVFYSMRGDIFVKDVDEILAKTAMFSAYKETLMEKQYGNIVKKYFSGTGLNDLYQIELISADAYNYKRVGAYDEVTVHVPVGDINTNNLSISVYNSSGIYNCDFTVEDDYLVITTKEFGMFMFMSGGKRNSVEFDYNDDLRNQLNLLKSDKKETAEKASNWLSTTSGKIVLIAVCGVAVIAIAGLAVYLILKKKGIILRKG